MPIHWGLRETLQHCRVCKTAFSGRRQIAVCFPRHDRERFYLSAWKQIVATIEVSCWGRIIVGPRKTWRLVARIVLAISVPIEVKRPPVRAKNQAFDTVRYDEICTGDVSEFCHGACDPACPETKGERVWGMPSIEAAICGHSAWLCFGGGVGRGADQAAIEVFCFRRCHDEPPLVAVCRDAWIDPDVWSLSGHPKGIHKITPGVLVQGCIRYSVFVLQRISDGCKADLLELAHANCSPGSLLAPVQRRQKQRHEKCDDGDYQQKLNQRKRSFRYVEIPAHLPGHPVTRTDVRVSRCANVHVISLGSATPIVEPRTDLSFLFDGG